MSALVSYEKDGRVGLVTLARPEKRNAFTTDMYAQFAREIRKAGTDDSVAVVVIKALGKTFSAGNDLSGFLDLCGTDPEEFAHPQNTPSVDAVFSLLELEKPLIAAVQGFAVGWGATMLLHCDLVFVAPDARLSFPFVKLGVVPEAGSTMLLASSIGAQRAARILFSGSTLDADEAVSLGIACEKVESSELSEYVDSAALEIAQHSREALSSLKRLTRRTVEPLSDRVTAEFVQLARLINTPEVQHGFQILVDGGEAR